MGGLCSSGDSLMTANRAKSIFLNAAEITSAEEREAYLFAECEGEETLRREVEDLLKHHGPARLFLEQPATATASVTELAAGEAVGGGIGPYKLLEPIGEGGMGTVWMAQQTEPVR